MDKDALLNGLARRQENDLKYCLTMPDQGQILLTCTVGLQLILNILFKLMKAHFLVSLSVTEIYADLSNSFLLR